MFAVSTGPFLDVSRQQCRCLKTLLGAVCSRSTTASYTSSTAGFPYSLRDPTTAAQTSYSPGQFENTHCRCIN